MLLMAKKQTSRSSRHGQKKGQWRSFAKAPSCELWIKNSRWCRIVSGLLNEVYKEVAPWGKPGYILFVQTFGDLVTFHPHIHALVADGVFVESGTFRVLPPIPTVLLAEPLRHAVLDYLVEDEAITEEFAHRLLSWKHSGFSVDNTVGVGANDPQGRRQLIGR